jgi:ribonuclease VapC
MAFLKGEQPGRQEVRKLLEEATAGKLRLLMSMINVGEIFYSLAKQQGHHYAEQFLSDLPGLPVETLVPSRNLILDAARWKAKAPISYADAFAVATAIEQEAELVTGDPELKRFRGQFVDWIGR